MNIYIYIFIYIHIHFIYIQIGWHHSQLFRFGIHYLMNALDLDAVPEKARSLWNYGIYLYI